MHYLKSTYYFRRKNAALALIYYLGIDNSSRRSAIMGLIYDLEIDYKGCEM